MTTNNSTITDFTNITEPTLIFPQYISVLYSVLCCTVFIVGVLGNLLVPIVLIRNKDMRNSTNYFLLNLSFADLMVLLVCLPTALVELSSPPDVWILGELMCKSVRFVEYAVVHGSVLSLMAISLERYYVVCRPLHVSSLCTKSRTSYIIVLIWITSLVTASPMVWIQTYDVYPYYDGTLQPVCTTLLSSKWAYCFIFGASIFFFFLPLLFLMTVYTIITKQLLQDPLQVNPDRSANQIKARRQVVTMLAMVVLSFFLCLLPLRVFFLWILVVPAQRVHDIGVEGYYNLVYSSRVLYYMNSCVNPILYTCMSTRFRHEFLSIVGLRRNSSFSVGTLSSSTRSGRCLCSVCCNSSKRSLIACKKALLYQQSLNSEVKIHRTRKSAETYL